MAAQIEMRMIQLRGKLDELNIPILNHIEETTSVRKEYVASASAAVLVFLFFLGIGAGSLCRIVGFIYPAYKSFETIEKRTRGEDTQWLIYWVVYGFFTIIETFVDFLLYWIPFYFAFKLAFLLWAMLPQTKGAKFLYDTFLKDFLKKNEKNIDKAIENAKKSVPSVVFETVSAAKDVAGMGLSATASYANSSTSSFDSKDGKEE
mmetsp:Transcript_40995/g.96242  ORF Transcript_40995/g.96242 Transcript_40995/m.96242 type:complete len:205 (-) Transcript_40995:409-1023(-)|eukprot:CAMPEP_0113307792 /NCGR_PEP_ID=MMETSP0010_2-20120614/6495_1 /TAXON_ID=216773 ORGANISM="Corethron hystrix, Strain 308" /NCGR_SAMPLE_ID=MMETSP0010_2 /ASSEMBLY_ACC=CAM_ASM_000155 /LENGTH=204 /DNA_ID=CAMNT_0000162717 /DNA_START=60 /DNA_END=674 /DNA_ORIENTATION=- /assembly_acc=CAM_ASM_000155